MNILTLSEDFPPAFDEDEYDDDDPEMEVLSNNSTPEYEHQADMDVEDCSPSQIQFLTASQDQDPSEPHQDNKSSFFEEPEHSSDKEFIVSDDHLEYYPHSQESPPLFDFSFHEQIQSQSHTGTKAGKLKEYKERFYPDYASEFKWGAKSKLENFTISQKLKDWCMCSYILEYTNVFFFFASVSVKYLNIIM